LTGRQRSLLQALTHAKTGNGQASMRLRFFFFLMLLPQPLLLLLLLTLLLVGAKPRLVALHGNICNTFQSAQRALSHSVQTVSPSFVVIGHTCPPFLPPVYHATHFCTFIVCCVLRPPTQLADFCENLYYLGDKFLDLGPMLLSCDICASTPHVCFGHGAVSSMPKTLRCGMPRFFFLLVGEIYADKTSFDWQMAMRRQHGVCVI